MEITQTFSLFCLAFIFWTFLCYSRIMRRHLTTAEAARAIGMLKAGQTQRNVAGQFNVSQSVISRTWNRYNQTRTVRERQRSGRPRCTTARPDRYFGNLAKRQRFHSAVRLIYDFRQATERRISSQTVRNRLHTANSRDYRPAVRPVLSRVHRNARRQWQQIMLIGNCVIGPLFSSRMSLGFV